MTPLSLPDTEPSATRTVTADTSLLPLNERHGDVRVSFFPGADIEVSLVLDSAATRTATGAVFTDEVTARSLYRCLDHLFGPLAASRAAVRSSVALAGGGR